MTQLTDVPRREERDSPRGQDRRTSGDALEDVLGALPEAIYLTDADGRITYYNDAAAVR